MPETDQRDFDEEFMQSIVAWRERHRLREDEAVLLLVELFRIHQSHWDEIRRRELPSFEEFRADIAKLTEAARTFQQQITAVLEVLQTHPPADRAAVRRWRPVPHVIRRARESRCRANLPA